MGCTTFLKSGPKFLRQVVIFCNPQGIMYFQPQKKKE